MKTKRYFFEYQVYHRITGEIFSSGSCAHYWGGTFEGMQEVKSFILAFVEQSIEIYDVRIISATHLFGEDE